MNRIPLAFGALLLLSLSSCKKEKQPDTPPKIDDIVFLDYSKHLKEGNYWIYQHVDIDTFGNETPTMQYDSIYAGKDTIINGHTYKVLMNFDGANYVKRATRDSLHYQVDPLGNITFSSVDFTNILRSYPGVFFGDTLADNTLQMTNKGKKITVPAGTFETITRTETWNMRPGYRNGGAVRKQITRYNIDIGIITEMIPFHPITVSSRERRLVRYRVQ